MRAFVLTLALTLPLGLAACQSDRDDSIEDRGEAIDDAYEDVGMDVIGDGEISDEPGEPEP